MTRRRVYAEPEPAIFNPITICSDLCIGCNECIEVCQVDLFLPNPRQGKPPLIMYPGECWFDGSCVEACPAPGAITLNSLLVNRVYWRERRIAPENDASRASLE